MTHRDGFPRLSARSAGRSGAGQREPSAPSENYAPSESLGKPPFRSGRRTGSGRPWGRRKALTMSRIARDFPPTRPLARRIACPISMGHYLRSLVLVSRPHHFVPDGRKKDSPQRNKATSDAMAQGRHVRSEPR